MLAIVVVYISSGVDSGNGIAIISGRLLKVLVLEVLLMLLVVSVTVS